MAAFLGCSKPDTPTLVEAIPHAATPSAPASTDKPGLDACSLLTAEEIQAVQGESLKETKPDTKSDGQLSVSQCYFALPTFSNSISLQVVRRGTGAGASEPRQVWQEMFHKEQPTPVGEGARKNEPPQPIEGIGDEAFWTGNQKLGALYVLQGNSFLRISIGGADDPSTKIKKSRDLAQIVLKRL